MESIPRLGGQTPRAGTAGGELAGGAGAATWAQTQGIAAWNWAMRFFNSPAGLGTLQTVGELVMGAQAPAAPCLLCDCDNKGDVP